VHDTSKDSTTGPNNGKLWEKTVGRQANDGRFIAPQQKIAECAHHV
jgi:hypothetical protein